MAISEAFTAFEPSNCVKFLKIVKGVYYILPAAPHLLILVSLEAIIIA